MSIVLVNMFGAIFFESAQMCSEHILSYVQNIPLMNEHKYMYMHYIVTGASL